MPLPDSEQKPERMRGNTGRNSDLQNFCGSEFDQESANSNLLAETPQGRQGGPTTHRLTPTAHRQPMHAYASLESPGVALADGPALAQGAGFNQGLQSVLLDAFPHCEKFRVVEPRTLAPGPGALCRQPAGDWCPRSRPITATPRRNVGSDAT